MESSTTFYNILSENRWRTAWLFLLFPIMIASIAFLAIFAIVFVQQQNFEIATLQAGDLFLSLIPFLTIGATIWILISLTFGKNMILAFSGANKIEKQESPELFRIVENLAIRTGIPTPSIYIIEDESMNAFATGFSPKNASVAITSGLLKKLNKNEIEAVMAHEFGHILHRDIRIMLIAVTMVGIIQLLAEIILRIFFRNIRSVSGGGEKKNSGQIIFVMIAIAVIIWAISFFGSIFVQMGISRKREFMADAESANLTRNPQSLITALQKISQDARVEVLDGKRSIAAMCITDPLEQKSSFFDSLSGLFASHPPVQKRIEALEGMKGM